MRRSWRTRLSAAFSALWLLLVLVQPPMLHTCEVHSGMHMSGAHDMASMDSQSQSSHDHTSPKQCTCVGDCCGVVPTALPVQRIAGVVVVTVLAPTSARAEHEYVAAWVDFVLPLATAPPAIV